MTMGLRKTIACAVVLVVAVLWAASNARSQQSESETPTIRVDVNVVNVLCSVRDRDGRLVADLDKSDFEIKEDGKPQSILYFARETQLPLTIGLLVDSSVSQQSLIAEEQSAADLFFRQVLTERDAAFLITFDSRVELLADVTGSAGRLRSALERIRVHGGAPIPQGPFPRIPTGGTHLYDAVFLASEDVLAREAGRKAIILISDGQDQGSRLSRDAAIETAQKTDAIIYGILFVDRRFYGFDSPRYSGESTMKRMAEQTGGRVFKASNENELSMAFRQISEELRSQYSLGYSPTNARRDGSFRKIDLRAKPRGLKVQARRGYYASMDETFSEAQ